MSRALIANTRHFRGGGDSTYTFNLAELLRREGHEVAFFAMQDERNLPDPNADLFPSHIDFKQLNHQKSPVTVFQVLRGRSTHGRRAMEFADSSTVSAPNSCTSPAEHPRSPHALDRLEVHARGIPVIWTLHDYKLMCPNAHFLRDRHRRYLRGVQGRSVLPRALRRCKKGSLLASAMASLEAYAHQGLGSPAGCTPS